MRIALVGLSSPCGYLYDHRRLFTRNQPWGWNPILESPLGLATLFDEIWFLHRALCPQAMRTLAFVKFINEERQYAGLIKGEVEKLSSYSTGEMQRRMLGLREVGVPRMRGFRQVIVSASGWIPGRDAPIDNHSGAMKFGEVSVTGNAWSAERLALDLVVCQKLSDRYGRRIELITNSFTNACILPETSNLAKLAAAQAIVVRRIPALQTVEGPVLVDVDRVRENRYVADFRKRISSAAASASIEDVNHLVAKVEEQFVQYRDQVLLAHQAKAGLLHSTARNLISVVAGKVLPPGILEGVDLLKSRETRRMSWTAFLACLETDRG